uniref:CAZy families GH13 protein n=1 Tax=uncultured Cytophaga sp. TaxID=160238 RepID=A0A060CFM1_9BACT|nr:CAZy families GH13 protein [uncultured Cytophaga sp.]
MRCATGREIFTVGEYWSGDVHALVDYLGQDAPMSLFDVPLHYKLFSASTAGEP